MGGTIVQFKERYDEQKKDPAKGFVGKLFSGKKATGNFAAKGSKWITREGHKKWIWHNLHTLRYVSEMDGRIDPQCKDKVLEKMNSKLLKWIASPKPDGKEEGIKPDANLPLPAPTAQKPAPKQEVVPQQITPKKTGFFDRVKSVVDQVKSVVNRPGKMIYGILGLGALCLSYGVYHYRDSIHFLAAKQPEKEKEPPTFFEKQKKKFEGYSTLQQVAGAGALLAGTVGAVAGCKRFRKPAPQEEEASRSICDSVCSESFWRTHGLKLGLGIIFLAGLVALVFCLPGNPGSEQQNDWD